MWSKVRIGVSLLNVGDHLIREANFDLQRKQKGPRHEGSGMLQEYYLARGFQF